MLYSIHGSRSSIWCMKHRQRAQLRPCTLVSMPRCTWTCIRSKAHPLVRHCVKSGSVAHAASLRPNFASMLSKPLRRIHSRPSAEAFLALVPPPPLFFECSSGMPKEHGLRHFRARSMQRLSHHCGLLYSISCAWVIARMHWPVSKRMRMLSRQQMLHSLLSLKLGWTTPCVIYLAVCVIIGWASMSRASAMSCLMTRTDTLCTASWVVSTSRKSFLRL